MKVAVSAVDASLDSEVDPRFGRCQYFVIVDLETLQFEAVANSSSAASGGAGIAAAQMIAGKGVKAVLTGNCGPNAYQVLSSSGIEVVTGVSGKIRDAIQDYKRGKHQASSQPNVLPHFGTGSMPGRGWVARGSRTTGSTLNPESLQQELSALKAQSQLLAKQLEEIQARVKTLESGGEGKERDKTQRRCSDA